MTTLSFTKAERILKELVKQNGEDFIYSNPEPDPVSDCLYIHNYGSNGQEPGCIVGHLLFGLGVSADFLHRQEGAGASAVLNRAENEGLVKLTGSKQESVSRLLDRVQGKQDEREPWGRAVKEALSEER